MKSKLIYPMVLVVFAIGCGGRGSARNAAQQQYETVQEGSAAGVTSTIHGPGETLPPITGTNADTTTAFTLNPAAIPPPGAAPQPLPSSYPNAGALPPMMSSSPSPMPAPVPAPIRRPVTTTQPPPEPLQPQPAPAPPAEPQQTETATTTAPATDTSTTTHPPVEEPKKEEPPPPPPPAGDTSGTQAEEPPPPPPPL